MSKRNKVYVILEVIDLGDHIVSIHWSERIANQKCEELMAEHRKQYGEHARREQYYVVEQIVEA
jgi:hypothetical protein